MKFQIYLSGMVQKHFGLATKDVLHDSEVEPESDWWARWRFEYVIESGDGSQHLFLATNEGSYYSFVLPLSSDKGFKDLVGLFLHHWMDAMLGRGFHVDEEILHETQFLRGRPNKLIGAMNQFVYHVTNDAMDGEDVKTMHSGARELLITKGKGYIQPDEEFERLMAAEPPYPLSDSGTRISDPEVSNIIQFPSPN